MKLAALALVAIAAVACAAPPPKPVAWYDAAADTIHYDPAWMAQVAAWYGQPGTDWITAHEEGHRTVFHLWQTEQVDVAAMMPGATLPIRLEQSAQCEAAAALGHGAPWDWDDATVALGYWRCSPEYVAIVKAAG